MPKHASEIADPVLDDLRRAPFQIAEPPARSAPFLFASPHSGRLYPLTLQRLSRLSALALRRSEDAHVDGLLAEVPTLGAPLICARFPRAYVDANRAPGELDVSMFARPLTVPVEQIGPRVNAGLGVIPRIVREGAEIYRGKLQASDLEDRLFRLHRPYHAALARLVGDTLARHGCAVVVDCHSMPSAAGTPDIVLGDRYGSAAAPALLQQAERAFEAEGFSMARNVPYAGGYTTHLYGRPAEGVHAVQVEINRGLYLDEERIEPTAGFAELRQRLTRALRTLVALAPEMLRPVCPLSIAAE